MKLSEWLDRRNMRIGEWKNFDGNPQVYHFVPLGKDQIDEIYQDFCGDVMEEIFNGKEEDNAKTEATT